MPTSSRASVSTLLAALLLSTGCASSGTQSEQMEEVRSLRHTLMFGPEDVDSPYLRVLWGTTLGLVTLPIWLPVLTFEVMEGDHVEPRLASKGDPMTASLTNGEPASVAAARESAFGVDFGTYHALVIGSNRYRYLPSLKTAVADARAVAELLAEEYGFTVDLLIDATRRDILASLHRLRVQLGARSNLLVYYAGHGYLDPDTQEGYWLPVDAGPEEPTNWLANSTITTMLKGLEAKHVLVVADSCYSGSLNRSAEISNHPPSYVYKLARKRARVVFTSGGLEPVQDAGPGRHSVFANSFLAALRENDRQVIEGSALFLRVRQPVMENALQTPEYGPIRLAGHGGGDFLFIRLPREPESRTGAAAQ